MIKITSIHLKLGKGFETFMRKALEKKVKKYQRKEGSPEIVIRKEGVRFKVEIKCAYSQKFLFVSEVSDNAKRAFFGAMEKLGRQLEKAHEKTRDYMGRVDMEKIESYAV